MNNQQYWAKRLDEIAQRRFNITNEVMQKELKAMYDEVATKMQARVEDLYYKMLEQELTRSEIYTYKHYRDLEKQINKEMVALGSKEVKLINGNLEWALEEVYKETGTMPFADKFALLSPAMVKEIVNRPWAAQHFTATCWKNKELLAQQLKKAVTESIITGKSKDKIVEEVMRKMKVGFSNADRVVRTELMHTINQGQIQRYKDTGYTKLEWNVEIDERTCERCETQEGLVVDIDSDNVPPVHARCRCTVCPVLDSIDNIKVQETPEESLPTTIKEAEQWAKDNLGLVKASYKGIDVEVANLVNQTLSETFTNYPILKGFVQEVCTDGRLSATAMAQIGYSQGKLHSALKISKKDLVNLANVDTMIKRCVKSKWWTPKDGAGGIINHELGHMIDYAVTLKRHGVDINSTNHVAIRSAFDDLHHRKFAEEVKAISLRNAKMLGYTTKEIVDNLSQYGMTNASEFLAEAFSETNPRKLAQEVKKVLDLEIKGAYK